MVLAFVPGDQVAVISPWIMYILGLMITGVYFAAMWLVLRWARQFRNLHRSKSCYKFKTLEFVT